MRYNNRTHTLKYEFFFTYFLGYIILTFIIFLIIIGSIVIQNFLCKNLVYNHSLRKIEKTLNSNYKSISNDDLSDINGFLITINSNNEINYKNGSIPSEFNSITLKSYMSIFGVNKNNTISLNSDLNSLLKGFNNSTFETKDKIKYSLYSKYLSTDDTLLLIGFPYLNLHNIILKKLSVSYNNIIGIIILLDFCFILTIIYYLAKLTAKNFVVPIDKLLNSIIEVSNGNYNCPVYLDCQNEFLNLADGFNMMSKAIKTEKNERKKLEESKNRMILDISHDLKNPLTAILGYSEILLNNSNLTDEDKLNYLMIINTNCKKSNKLMLDLFEFSLYTDSNFKLKLNRIDICEFLRQLIASYIPELEQNNFTYDFKIDDSCCYCMIDEIKFSRAISNILDNMLKYNPADTQIVFKWRITKTKFIVFISDNGIGIPKDYHESIFYPFVRVDESRNSNTGGTGLGLYISKKILNLHNGDITILPSNVGTNFKISLIL